MATYQYRNRGTNQVVFVDSPMFDGNPLWEPIVGGGGGDGVSQAELDSQIGAVEADTTNIHGIANTALLETTSGSAAKVTAHAGAADPHADRAFATTAISTHAGAGDPHGDRTFATSAVANHTGAVDPHGDRAFATSGLAGKVGKGDLVFDIRDYGASTGAASNNVAIQAAVDAAATAGGRVFIPSGLFYITPPTVGAAIQLKAGLKGIFGNGTSSILKVIDSVPGGEYYAIMSCFNGSTSVDVGGLTLSDFDIDQNNTHNQWTTAATQYTVYPRFCLYIPNATTKVTVQRVGFLDLDGTNCISISGTVRDHTIDSCRFFFGTSSVDHDTSIIYTNPAGQQSASSVITNNIFRSPGPGSFAARTAIETHGGAQHVTGNVIDGFAKGGNICGISVYGYEGIVVSGNVVTNAKWGFMLWSYKYSTNTTRGLKHCVIRDNVIRLNGPGWAPVYSGSGYANGIVRDNSDPSLTLPFEDILIDSNIITFDNTGYTGLVGDTIGNGIEWRETALATLDKRVVIRNNRIDSPLASGIRWQALGESIEIVGNMIRNPGRGSVAAGGAMTNGSANGIIVNGALTNSHVSDNLIVDDQNTPTTNVGVYLFPTAAGSLNNRATGNKVPVANSKKIETVTSSFAGNWYVTMLHESYTAITGNAAVGSAITDRTTGIVRTQTTAPVGTTWTAAQTSYNRGTFIAAGYYVTPEGARLTAAIGVADTEYAVPIWFANSGTLVRAGVSVTSATSVTAGTVIRLGLRADNGAGKPGTLIADFGTVAGDAVASPEITISQAVSAPGLYWLTATCQLAGATLPTVRVLAGTNLHPVAAGTNAGALGSGLVAYTQTGVTGALGSTFTVANQVTSAALIAVRG